MTDQVVPSQVKMVIRSVRSLIAEALKTRIETVRELRYVAYDRIRLRMADFGDTELPAVQIIDVSDTRVEQQGARAKRSWFLEVEVIMRSTENLVINQQDLWNLCESVERAIMREPTLGVKGVLHCLVNDLRTDLHLDDPLYFGIIELEVQYFQNQVRDC